jgi:hypothetical protein
MRSVNQVFQSTLLSNERRARDKSVPQLIETIGAPMLASSVRPDVHHTHALIASIGRTRARRWQMFCF